MKVVNVLNDSLKSQDLKNKIIIISKSQLNQVFDLKNDKEIINGLKYIDSNKIETYEDKFLLTFNFLTEENKRGLFGTQLLEIIAYCLNLFSIVCLL